MLTILLSSPEINHDIIARGRERSIVEGKDGKTGLLNNLIAGEEEEEDNGRLGGHRGAFALILDTFGPAHPVEDSQLS